MSTPVSEVLRDVALVGLAAPSADTASGRLSLVILALVVLAVVITVVTVLFWRSTRPEVHVPPVVTGSPDETTVSAEPGADDDVTPDGG